MSLKTNCKNFKSRSCPNNSLTFIDKYKFEVFYDRKYFGDNTKIYHCDKCDICFIDPMPSNETLDNFYKLISNIQEVKARKGVVIAVVTSGDTQVKKIADYIIEIPETIAPK